MWYLTMTGIQVHARRMLKFLAVLSAPGNGTHSRHSHKVVHRNCGKDTAFQRTVRTEIAIRPDPGKMQSEQHPVRRAAIRTLAGTTKKPGRLEGLRHDGIPDPAGVPRIQQRTMPPCRRS